MDHDVERWLLKRIFKDTPTFTSDLWLRADFVSEGHIDSFGSISLVLDIEQEFGVELTNEDIASKEFRTIEGLAKIIRSKK